MTNKPNSLTARLLGCSSSTPQQLNSDPMTINRKSLRIKCVTYNLNRGKATEDLSGLLFDQPIEREADLPDFYAIGFQELAGLHLTFPSLTRFAIHDRQQSIIRGFSTGLRTIKDRESENVETDLQDLIYNLVASRTHGGLGLLVYARNDTVFPAIKQVQISTASCGFLDLMNNKGAIGVRLTMGWSENDLKQPAITREVITFVNAHLSAHDSGIEARNRNYLSIVNRLLFETGVGDETRTIYDSSHLFFIGDLNYRISLSPLGPSDAPPLSKQDLSQLIRAGRHLSLFPDHDTLTHQHASRKVLVGLREGSVEFKPTYKYECGKLDKLVSLDSRLPGWTDRIFFGSWDDDHPTTDPESGSKLIQYQSLQTYCGSDHKPVFAVVQLSNRVPSSTDSVFLTHRPQIEIDQWWRTKRVVGGILDKACGAIMLLAMVAGFGNLELGFVNLGIGISWKLWR